MQNSQNDSGTAISGEIDHCSSVSIGWCLKACKMWLFSVCNNLNVNSSMKIEYHEKDSCEAYKSLCKRTKTGWNGSEIKNRMKKKTDRKQKIVMHYTLTFVYLFHIEWSVQKIEILAATSAIKIISIYSVAVFSLLYFNYTQFYSPFAQRKHK